MAKRLIINGKEEKPAKKIKLYRHKPVKEISELIKRKRLEQESSVKES